MSAAVPEEADPDKIFERLNDDPDVLSVYSDPRVEISALARCMKSDPVGKVHDVAASLKVGELHSRGMNGSGVLLVIVDAGINLAFLREKGRHHSVDHDLSWSRAGGPDPGKSPAPRNSLASHGTVAAFAAGIAAPDCTIVDLAAFGGATPARPRLDTWLSDIERGLQRIHRHLATTPNDERRVVIANSWALVDPDWDEPEGTELNFSDNADHRFSRYLGELVELGADIVFASGNAGSPCNMYGDLMGDQPISGANSLDSVLTTGAVAVDGERLGYSSSGPGRLHFEKPDLCGFSHYDGSGLWRADGGTSVACPVVAGVIAAIRTRVSAVEMPPRELARVLRETAKRSNGDQYDPDTGWGIIDPGAALAHLKV